MRQRILPGLLAALGLALQSACASAPPPSGEPYRWPAPPGWRTETFALPPEFDASFPFQGTEVLRFAPGWAKPESPEHWTYAFAWWVPQESELSVPTLTTTLGDYFYGLCQSVGGQKFTMDRTRFRALVQGTPAPTQAEVALYDCFTTGKPLDLRIKIRILECREAKHRVALFALSPRALGDPVWRPLDRLLKEFECPPGHRRR
jgi:hypothetical protein